MNTYNLHRNPYLRLIIPWIAGVFCGERFFDSSVELLWGILAFCFFSCLAYGSYFLNRYSLRWCFGVVTLALCFIGGWIGVTWQLKQTVCDFPKETTVYRAQLTDAPKEKERTFLCTVLVKERYDSVGVHQVGKKCILYLQKDSDNTVSRLKASDELLVSSLISPPSNSKNFDEFDYARYLLHKSISGTGYVGSGKWRLTAASSFGETSSPGFTSSLRLNANSYREKVLELYRKLGFAGDELAVLSALTVGDKAELSESIRESYSIAGASHVLALSGLHIGILYAMLLFLLKPISAKGIGGRILRALILLLLLWSFAFFTGLSPSVVRSVSMCSILALANMLNRKALTLNTMAATAWFMLLVHPVWLFDVGFQLSFLAVTSILLLQKPIYQLIPVKTRIGKYTWGIMSVSIAAQIGTAPLVMLYFSRFSTHFLLTNLVVILLVTIILYSAILMLILTPLSFIQSIVAEAVKSLLNGLNAFVRWIEQLPYSSIDGIWLNQVEVLGIYITLLFVLCFFATRRLKSLVICLCSFLLLGTYHTTMQWINRPHSSLVFYNVHGCPSVHCIHSNRQSWISYGDTLPDKKRLHRTATPYWNHCQLLPPKEIPADYQDTNIRRHHQMISYQGNHICMITDNRWRNKSASSPLYIQYLYLCKGFDGRLEELTRLLSPSCIILDSSLSDYRRESLKEECRQSGLRFISLSDEGSVRFLL